MNGINTNKRHDELAQVAQRLGADLPAFPTPDELAPVVKAIMLETGCMRSSAHHAIVAGVLRPKRRCADSKSIQPVEGIHSNENR